MEVNLNIIPTYLFSSDLYISFSENDDNNVFIIPNNCMKLNLTIESDNDVRELLETLRFWMSDLIPYELFNYLLKNSINKNLLDEINEEYGNELMYINTIKKISKLSNNDEIIKLLSQLNEVELLENLNKYVNESGEKIMWKKYNISYLIYLNNNLKINEISNDNIKIKSYLNIIKYLHENGCVLDKETCKNASLNGHLECLKYAHENGCDWDKETCKYAASKGHLECLKYAHENGCEWDKVICNCAALNGHLECLKYLHDNGCAWDKETCEYAAFYGHLNCLKYAHDNGCD
jgi:hypothetical protein